MTETMIFELRRSAEKGDPSAMNKLFEALSGTPEMELHEGEAEEWCESAADVGHPLAMFHMGCIEVADECYERAEKWFRMAAEDGVSAAETGRRMAERLVTFDTEAKATELFNPMLLKAIHEGGIVVTERPYAG